MVRDRVGAHVDFASQDPPAEHTCCGGVYCGSSAMNKCDHQDRCTFDVLSGMINTVGVENTGLDKAAMRVGKSADPIWTCVDPIFEFAEF